MNLLKSNLSTNMNRIIEFCNTKDSEWVFFDFFDTIVHRQCKPEDVKRIWAKKLYFILDCTISHECIYKVRRESEIYLNKLNIENCGEFTYLELCKEIYKRFSIIYKDMNLSLSISSDEFYESCLKEEVELEKKFQYIDQETCEAIHFMKNKNKKLVIISDFYLPRPVIEIFLNNVGLSHYFDEIFISCDMNCNKLNGSIYRKVLGKLHVTPDKCIMIGDSLKSDVTNAQKYGITAYHKEWNASKNGDKFSENHILKEFKRIQKRKNKGELSYSNYAFSLFLFIEKLYTNLKKTKIRNVYFLAREGELLKKLFDIYQNSMVFFEGAPINSHYLFVSRQSTYAATLKNIEEENFNVIFKEYKSISPRAFFASIGFSKENINELSSKIHLNIHQPINNFQFSDEFNLIKKNDLFIRKYNDIRNEKKRLLKAYFSQEDVDKQNKIVIVDVGWKGTMQNNIYNLYNGTIPVEGYYFGTTESCSNTIKNRKLGLMFSANPYKSEMFQLWSFDKTFLERLLFATHPSTSGYCFRNGKIEPILTRYDKEKASYDIIKPIQTEIISKFKHICDAINGTGYFAIDFNKWFVRTHLDTLFNIEKSNMLLQKTMYDNQFENFGYNIFVKEVNEKLFEIKNIILNIKSKLYLLKQTELVARILMHYKLYLPIKLIYRVQKLYFYKKLH